MPHVAGGWILRKGHIKTLCPVTTSASVWVLIMSKSRLSVYKLITMNRILYIKYLCSQTAPTFWIRFASCHDARFRYSCQENNTKEGTKVIIFSAFLLQSRLNIVLLIYFTWNCFPCVFLPLLHAWDFLVALIMRVSASPVDGRCVTDRDVMHPSTATRVTQPHVLYFSANLMPPSVRARQA